MSAWSAGWDSHACSNQQLLTMRPLYWLLALAPPQVGTSRSGLCNCSMPAHSRSSLPEEGPYLLWAPTANV